MLRFILAVILMCSPIFMAATARADDYSNTPPVIDTRNLDAAAWAKLMDHARQKGTIRVNLALRFEMQDTDNISPEDEKRQNQQLAELQKYIARKILGPQVPADNVGYLQSMPYMWMVVNTAQLRHLMTVPYIASIQEENAPPEPPQGIAPDTAVALPVINPIP